MASQSEQIIIDDDDDNDNDNNNNPKKEIIDLSTYQARKLHKKQAKIAKQNKLNQQNPIVLNDDDNDDDEDEKMGSNDDDVVDMSTELQKVGISKDSRMGNHILKSMLIFVYVNKIYIRLHLTLSNKFYNFRSSHI